MPGPKPQDEATRFWNKVQKTATCWLWTGKRLPKGYGEFRRSNPRQMVLAHRFAWVLQHGAIPSGLDVLHNCDNPPCVRGDHLCLGTAQDNSDDMVSKGRRTRKLTDAQVAEILASSESGPTLAERYGVSRGYIGHLRRGIAKRSKLTGKDI